MAKKHFGSINVQNQGQFQWSELASNGSNYVAFQAPASLSANVVWTLPAADSSGTQALVSNGSGVLSFSNLVTSVNGFSGTVTLSTTDIGEGTNLYFTDERAQDAVGGILVDTDDIDLVYNDGTPSITAALKSTAISAKSSVAAASADEILISDASDSGNLKKVTAQSIADLATVASHKSNWVTADTATKAITHSLNSLDVLVQIVDVASGETIEIDSVVRTDVNTVTVTANQAPPATNWRVLILKV